MVNNEAELELQMAGLKKQYDYTEFAHNAHVNVIPESDFKRLVSDTFKTITFVLKQTYGPYACMHAGNLWTGIHCNHP